MPREFPRSRRVEEQIQRILSDVIRTHARDPRLSHAIVTGVSVSRDLSVAWIYVSSLDDCCSVEDLEAAFGAAAGFLRSQLARELSVRQVPELRFRVDETTARGQAMDRLLAEARAKDRGGDPGQGQGD
jgi:ribosome-binding factor A